MNQKSNKSHACLTEGGGLTSLCWISGDFWLLPSSLTRSPLWRGAAENDSKINLRALAGVILKIFGGFVRGLILCEALLFSLLLSYRRSFHYSYAA